MPNASVSPLDQARSDAAFAAAIAAERDTVGDFITLLQHEQEALVRGDADGVAALAPGKARLLDQLASSSEQRDRFLAAQSLGADKHGVETWLGRYAAPDGAAYRDWKELLHLAERARRLNQANGLMIEDRLLQNRQRITVLLSAAAADSVYHANGQLRPSASRRPLSSV